MRGQIGRVSARQADEEILEALSELFEAFVVDGGPLSDWQARAARQAAHLLAPYWREQRREALRRAARTPRRVA